MTGVLEWARAENLQPEPLTLDHWHQLPREFARLVEVVNGDIVRAEAPSLWHGNAAKHLSSMFESAAETHMSRYQDGVLYVGTGLDVLLWETPRLTVRRPDIVMFSCSPSEMGLLPASRIRVVVEVVTPVSERVDTTDKQAEYAAAGIPWYWLVYMDRDRVAYIQTFVLVLGHYRPHRRLLPIVGETVLDMPIEIRLDWHWLIALAY
ncbi:Uma2 family endonuclease [Nocardia sp. NPDC003693]